MNKLYLLLGALLAGFLLTGCVKKEFDNPPDTSNYDPGVPAGTNLITVAQLKAMNPNYYYQTGGDTTTVKTDVSIAVIVTADDRSGNYYKALNIEDSTGGIQIVIDAYSLYNTYPVGRKIYVKCKGLTLGWNGGTPVLGMGVDEQMSVLGINGSQIEAHVIKASVGHTVVPKVVTMTQITATGSALDRSLLDRLVTIQDVEFIDSTGVKTYSQPNGTTNRDFKDCSGKKATVRTSNYANFAAIRLPTGKGTLTGVFSIFTSSTSGNISPQLLIRDTGDVKMYGLRCGGGTGGPGTLAPLISIDSLRKLYTSSNIKLGSYRIHGTVISDAANGNVTTNLIVLQDGSRGISVYGLTGATYSLGDSLVIDVTGDSLLNYRGSLEVKIMGGSTVTKAASNVPVVARTVTISQINSSPATYEWTLVKILNPTLTGGTTWNGTNGNLTLTDATGSMTHYTAATASFKATTIPATLASIQGIMSQYNTTRQLQVRNPVIDVQ